MKEKRIDGEGYHLGVWRKSDGSHYLALPVSSSFVTDSFAFDISEKTAAAICADLDLKMKLDKQLHKMLQGRITKGLTGATDEQCIRLVNEIVHEKTN